MSTPRVLSPYYCRELNPRTGLPCNTVLIDAWSLAGALVRRKCKQCGTWSVVEVEADPTMLEAAFTPVSAVRVLD